MSKRRPVTELIDQSERGSIIHGYIKSAGNSCRQFASINHTARIPRNVFPSRSIFLLGRVADQDGRSQGRNVPLLALIRGLLLLPSLITPTPRNSQRPSSEAYTRSLTRWQEGTSWLLSPRFFRRRKIRFKRTIQAEKGERRGEERRGHNDRGRIMTIITIYMQVPSLPAHEQSTHSISYLI